MVSNFVSELRRSFEEHRNDEIASGQKAYMKNNFEFLGLKTEVRRALAQPFMIREHLPPKEDALAIVKECWEQDEREFQMFGQDFLLKYTKKLDKQDISFLEYLVTYKSWWDSVDLIATKAVGDYMKKFPEQRQKFLVKWCSGNNMWLRRTAILFQLKYKKDADLELLTYAIEQNLGSKEFFINKAIGWVLRDYSRVDAQWVLDFVDAHPELSKLSKHVATSLIKE